jgi:hypothetical protein
VHSSYIFLWYKRDHHLTSTVFSNKPTNHVYCNNPNFQLSRTTSGDSPCKLSRDLGEQMRLQHKAEYDQERWIRQILSLLHFNNTVLLKLKTILWFRHLNRMELSATQEAASTAQHFMEPESSLKLWTCCYPDQGKNIPHHSSPSPIPYLELSTHLGLGFPSQRASIARYC